MTWPFENDTSNIEKKLAKRSLHHERQRNLFAIIAISIKFIMVNPFLVLYNLVDIFNRRTNFNMVQ